MERRDFLKSVIAAIPTSLALPAIAGATAEVSVKRNVPLWYYSRKLLGKDIPVVTLRNDASVAAALVTAMQYRLAYQDFCYETQDYAELDMKLLHKMAQFEGGYQGQGCVPEWAYTVATRKWVLAKKQSEFYKIGSLTRVKNLSGLSKALEHGRPVLYVINRGFDFPTETGWAEPTSSHWYHILTCLDYIPGKGGFLMNTWGAEAYPVSVNDSPKGGFYTSEETLEKNLATQECYAVNSVERCLTA